MNYTHHYKKKVIANLTIKSISQRQQANGHAGKMQANYTVNFTREPEGIHTITQAFIMNI